VIAQIHPRERGELDVLATRRLRRYDERRYGSTLLLFYEDAGEASKADGEVAESGKETTGRSAREAEAGEHEHDEPSG
jgi:hypothetical protein